MPDSNSNGYSEKDWEEFEKKHDMWISDRSTFCSNLADPNDEVAYLMEDAKILAALIKAISEDVEKFFN